MCYYRIPDRLILSLGINDKLPTLNAEFLANPITSTISQARYWINQMNESLLQSKLSNVFDIFDVSLEREKVSFNIDIYIKSENMLSLSLNTNFIIFDEFSGMEDMEKLSAINLTINSSPQYEVNSYLVGELSNSDKSKTMDKAILNIRAHGNSSYSTFDNINQKVVLLDNQSP